jgi:hypothetical protein
MRALCIAISLFMLGFISTLHGQNKTSKGLIFDIDLTKGPSSLPKTAKITGGKWDKGWRVADNTKPERIVIDAGRNITSGILEISFTTNESPLQRGKRNYAGIHEHPHLNQNLEPHGDILYARSGNQAYKFSKIKAFVRKHDQKEFEESLGDVSDWIPDDKFVHTIRFEWGGGTAKFTGPKGSAITCPKEKCGINADQTLDKLRYVFLGSDDFTGLPIKGMRFTRVKLVDNTEHLTSK